jgi:CubicO group peptidase (beta-lactamase class C family)
MKTSLSFLLILFCTVSIAQQNGKHTIRKTVTEASNAILDSFENDIRNEIAAKDIAGAAYVLYHKGAVVRMKAFGESDVDSHRPMQTTDIFRLASTTKPIASLALLLLQEDGLINMNDRLEKYLPAFTNLAVLDKIDTLMGMTVLQTHPAKNPILLRHLLTHTAGFASQHNGELKSLYQSTFKDISANDLTYFADQLASLPLNHEPGDGWIYGPSINIAAKVIEQVSGMSFQDFLKKRILGPMQMHETRFYLDLTESNKLTTLYTRDANGVMKVADPGTVSSRFISGPKVHYSGSGGLTSTLNDYLKFCVMILNNGLHEGIVVAKPETIALMKTDQVPLNINADLNTQPGQLTEGFTFGYQIARTDNNRSLKPKGTISWFGATGSIFFIDPQEKVIGIYMTQMQPYSHINSRKNFSNSMLKSIMK